MAYAQIDDSFEGHAKVLALLDRGGLDGLAAVGLWTLCLSYAHRQATSGPIERAGIISPAVVRRYGGTDGARLARLLCSPPPGYEHGLWLANGSGWVIHDFAYWQELARMQAKSAQSRSAANARWRNAARAAGLGQDQDQLDLGIGAPGPAAGDAPPDAGADAGAMHITEHNRTQPNRDARLAASDRFPDFWETYPRKVGKIKARESWDKVMALGVDPQAVVDGARRYRDDPDRAKKYTAHPATWLNQGRWEDDDDPGPGPGDRTGSFPFE